MKLTCYTLTDQPMALVPGRSDRDWMDATSNRFAYRCLPLLIANATGWEMLCPLGFSATWDGGAGVEAIVCHIDELEAPFDTYVTSHFGNGVLTFSPGYLFQTDPGWALWARGAPNWPKDGIAPLDGLVETDWLPFTFTMNWIFTRPGTVRFEKDEPIAFVTPVPHLQIENIVPEIRPIADAPELKQEYRTWALSRTDFNRALDDRDEAAVKEAWQRFYVRGTTATGRPAGGTHRSKRRLAKPRVLHGSGGDEPGAD
jgi:hypothetical protein